MVAPITDVPDLKARGAAPFTPLVGPVFNPVLPVVVGTFSPAIGDDVQFDTEALPGICLLPPITSANRGGCICVGAFPVTNTLGVSTLPAGSDTVAGIPASSDPGFDGPAFAVVLMSDGVNNWILVSFSSFYLAAECGGARFLPP